MLNILLAGVGGQGTVLAAKLLAAAAQEQGWQVRTAETIGMSQRGGSVVSHVRMGNAGEEVYAPLLAKGTADLIIAFEPAEAARVLPYLKPTGTLVTAQTPIQPVTAAMGGTPYVAAEVVDQLAERVEHFLPVDDAMLIEHVGNRRALNVVLLTAALATSEVGISVDDLRDAIRICVKPKFVDMNLAAVDTVLEVLNAPALC